MAVLFDPRFQAVDATGKPYSGAQLYFYRGGTTSLIPIYKNSDASTPHANPVVANTSGAFPAIFIASANPFKIILKSAAGVTLDTIDRIPVGEVIDLETLGQIVDQAGAEADRAEVAAEASAGSAAEAAGYAAGLNIAPIVPGDAGKLLQVNEEEDGSDWVDPPSSVPPDGSVTFSKLADALVQDDTEPRDDTADNVLPTVKRVATMIGGSSVLSPESFGCVGDGVTDDSANYLSALSEAATSGKTLVHTPGKTYLLNTWAPLGFFTNGVVRMQGFGAASKIKGPAAGAYFLRPGSRFDIDGLDFDRWTGVVRRDIVDGGEIIGAHFANNVCQNITGIPFNIECPFKDSFVVGNTLQDCSGGYGIRVGENTNNVAETVASAAVTVASDTIAVASNTATWITGARVRLTTTGGLPAGLAGSTDYYIIRVSNTAIKLANSYANAMAGTAIDITSQGTGNHTITHPRQDTWSGYQILNNILRRFTASGSVSGFPILATGINVAVNGNDIDGLISTDGEAVAIYAKLRHSSVSFNRISNIASTGASGAALDVAGISLKGAIRSVTNSGINGFKVICQGNQIRGIGSQGTKGSGIRCQIAESTVEANIIQDVGVAFISVDDGNGTSYNKVINNHCEAFNILPTYGIYLSTFGSSTKICGNTIKDAKTGMILSNASGNTILSTLVDGNSIYTTIANSTAFLLTGSAGGIAGMLITGNDVTLPATGTVVQNNTSVARVNVRNNDFTPAISSGAALLVGSATGITFVSNP